MGFEESVVGPVTRVKIARYASAVGDFNPIHVDEQFATESGLPSTVAHGPLTLTLLIDALVAQLGADALGAVRARLTAPVFPGDELTVREAGERKFEVVRGEDVVLTAEIELR